MKTRQLKILNYLLVQDDYVPAQILADKFDVTPKTIYIDINVLRDELKSYNLEIDKRPYRGIKVIGKKQDINKALEKANTLKEKILFWNRNKKEERQVLEDINIEINKGEAVALIGVNGGGKSTLLKLMTKIIYPDKGKITTNGKLTSLLELGAGFHPDFSGRENIYFNASIFGLTEDEINKRLDKIIEFSELGTYIDNPVRTYSSGMYMRLAFSVAINVDAEILLVDEILSVGDQHFQEKCLKKMKELKAEGKTMVFVTHSLDSAKELCDRAIWIHKGKVKMDGDTSEVIKEYIKETT